MQQRTDALQVYDIELQVLSGRKLAAKDMGGKSDPFVKISIGDETAQTKVVKNNLNPSWKETFAFRFFSNPRAIRFDVLDKDQLSDDKMGSASFNLETLFNAQSPIFEGNLKLDSKGTLAVRITANRFSPRAQKQLISAQSESIARHKETMARQERVIAQQKEMASKQSARIEELTVSLAQSEARAMAQSQSASQPGPGSAAAATRKFPMATKEMKAKAVTKMKATSATMKTGFYLGLAQLCALWYYLLAALYAIPLIDELVLALGSALRLGCGLSVFAGATTSKRPPTKLLKLYERENCAECKMVREALSSLDLDVIIYPVLDETSRFAAEAQRLSGKNSAALPILVDENYGDDGPLILVNSSQIIRYLFDEYGNAVTLSAMDRIRQRIVGSAPMTALFGAFLAVLRPMTAKAQSETVSPAQMLEVWSYEASPFCTKVREVLCALQMAYVLKNVAHGSKQKRGEFAIRFGKKYPAWKQKVGALQLPLLIDANTGAELFKVAEIEQYLRNTYCVSV